MAGCHELRTPQRRSDPSLLFMGRSAVSCTWTRGTAAQRRGYHMPFPHCLSFSCAHLLGFVVIFASRHKPQAPRCGDAQINSRRSRESARLGNNSRADLSWPAHWGAVSQGGLQCRWTHGSRALRRDYSTSPQSFVSNPPSVESGHSNVLSDPGFGHTWHQRCDLLGSESVSKHSFITSPGALLTPPASSPTARAPRKQRLSAASALTKPHSTSQLLSLGTLDAPSHLGGRRMLTRGTSQNAKSHHMRATALTGAGLRSREIDSRGRVEEKALHNRKKKMSSQMRGEQRLSRSYCPSVRTFRKECPDSLSPYRPLVRCRSSPSAGSSKSGAA